MPHTMKPEAKGPYYSVRNERGLQVGSIHNIRASDGLKAWRFIGSRAVYADLLPVPTPPHATPEAALAYVDSLRA